MINHFCGEISKLMIHDYWIQCLLLVDETKLISCGGHLDKKIKIWNLDIFECLRVLEGHLGAVYNLELTTEGNLLSCSDDETVKLWQIETGNLLKSIQFDYPVYCVKILTDNLFAIGLENGEIQINDWSKKESLDIIKAHTSLIHQLTVLPNSNNLLSGSGSGDIKLWEIRK